MSNAEATFRCAVEKTFDWLRMHFFLGTEEVNLTDLEGFLESVHLPTNLAANLFRFLAAQHLVCYVGKRIINEYGYCEKHYRILITIVTKSWDPTTLMALPITDAEPLSQLVSPKKKIGRPSATKAEKKQDAAIVVAWGTGDYRSTTELEQAFGLKPGDYEKIAARYRQRERRSCAVP